MATHFHSTDIRNSCPFANDSLARGTSTPRHVTCPACLRAIHAFDRSEAETQKSATAITRRVPAVTL